MADRLDEIGPGRVVSVFGSGAENCGEGDQGYQDALDVGRVLGEAGYAVVNGGYGGTMEASARGASEGGGAVIGVTCSVWRSKTESPVRSSCVFEMDTSWAGKSACSTTSMQATGRQWWTRP